MDQNYLLRYALIIVITLTFISFGIYFTRNDDFAENQFFKTNDINIDSLIETLRLEEKVKQLIVAEITDSTFFDAKYLQNYSGAYVICSDSNFSISTEKNEKIPILRGISHSVLLRKIEKTIKKEYLLLLTKKERLEYFAFLKNELVASDFNLLFTEKLYSSKWIISDSIFSDSLLAFHSQFSHYLFDNKIIPLIDLRLSKNDSISKNQALTNKLQMLYPANITNSDLTSMDSEWQQLQFFYSENEHVKSFLSSEMNLLFTDNPKKKFEQIMELIENDDFSESDLNKKLKLILQAKFWTKQQNTDSEDKKTNSILEKQKIRWSLKKHAVVVCRNTMKELPFKDLTRFSPLVIVLGKKNLLVFKQFVGYYSDKATFRHYQSNTDLLKTKLPKNYSHIIIVLNDYEADSSVIAKFAPSVESPNKRILVNMNRQENLDHYADFYEIVQVENNSEKNQKMAAELLFGGIAAEGKIASPMLKTLAFESGEFYKKIRLNKSSPEQIGINSLEINKIDQIAQTAIGARAFPGCQIFVAQAGQIIYNKSFGFHTYRKKQRVQHSDLYDIASVTKIAATTIAAMKMYEENKIELDGVLGDYFVDKKIEYNRIKPDTLIYIDTLLLSEIYDLEAFTKKLDTIHLSDSMIVAYDTSIVRSTPSNNIFKVKVRDLLRHKSGVAPAVPIFKYMFYKSYFLRDSLKLKLKKDSLEYYYRNYDFSPAFSHFFRKEFHADSSFVQIADSMFLSKEFTDSLWADIKQIPVFRDKFFVYSDINMVLLQMAIDSVNQQNMDHYMKKEFYDPLGLQSISYHPLLHFAKKRIIPTEHDYTFRGQLLHGFVHDPSAAMLGGIAGNAGLYASAQNLGVLFYMISAGGEYGGKRYLNPATISLFAQKQKDTHRALGFDMQGRKAIVAPSASPTTYGHTGYTGTCVWIDPENDLVFIFLSNLVHPSSKNWKINGMRVRQAIHEQVYKAMGLAE